ncbi:hypothetical protein ACQKWADRAFT_301577 [Trichoderma austrokoningii]
MADTAADSAPVAVFKKRGAKGKANIRKRPATPPPAASDSDSDYSSSEDESGQRVKRRKKTAVVTAAARGTASTSKETSAVVYAADRSVPIADANDATKHSNWYDEGAKDALSAKNLLGSAAANTYKGLANQTTFIQRNPDAPRKTVGPIKAPTNIRTVTTVEYNLGICKDYRKTGSCGFGDGCVFLHDRSDMKQGWQLDLEWEKVTKGKKNLGGTVVASANRDQAKGAEDDDEDDLAILETIPWACAICEDSYKEPIVTRCGHYFCLPCALQRYKKDPMCAACGAGTNGVFNSATRLKKLLEQKRQRVAQKQQEATGSDREQ